MSIFLNDNFSTEFPKPLDNRYGPFDDVASALAFLEPYKRYIGLTVGIGTSTIIEYWFDGGILDANFIVKSDHSVVDWGDIGGTLSNQTDLQTALNLKLDASIVSGGLTGQILAKDSNADYDVSWIDNYTEDIRDTVKATQAINKGQAVYISGANGTNQLATKADYSSEQTSSQTIGLAYQNFVTNQIGQIITQGLLTGIDTSGANAAGDPVYLGANGNLIYGYANKPKAPYHLVYIGIVTRKNANNGEIYVKIQNGYELEELHNVAITSPTNNQGIFYNSTNGLWENKSIITALGYTPVSESGSYSNPSWLTELAWGKITSTPTTIAGYGITDGVSTGGSYANPTWLTSLAWGKITSTPTTLSGYGITDGVSTSGSYSNPSWITDLAFSKITGYSVPTLAQVTTAGATTTNFITVGGLTANGSVTASAALARGNYINNTLVASANNDVLVGLDINPTFTNGSFTGISNYILRLGTRFQFQSDGVMNFGSTADRGRLTWDGSGAYLIGLSGYGVGIGSSGRLNNLFIFTNGNVLIQSGGTMTDAGYRLDVNGTTRLNGLQTFQGTTASDAPTLGSELATTGSGTNWAGTSFATGYTHTVGSTANLTTTLAAVAGASYQISVTMTGRTAGSIFVTVGNSSTSTLTSSAIMGVKANNTSVLTVTPTTDFDGTIILSVKLITASSAITTWNSSGAVALATMRYNGNTNLSWGIDAGSFITTAVDNIAIGYQAGVNIISGNYNIAIGSQALNSATFSTQNIAIGYQVLKFNNNSTGQNIGIGYNALSSSSNTGLRNTAIGTIAGSQITTGGNNVLIGYNSASGLTTGANNVSVGTSIVLSTNSTLNTLIGFQVNGTGSNNTVLGASANTGAFNASIILGASAAATASNQFVVGSTTYPAGTITTAVAPVINEYWTVIINGQAKKIALIA